MLWLRCRPRRSLLRRTAVRVALTGVAAVIILSLLTGTPQNDHELVVTGNGASGRVWGLLRSDEYNYLPAAGLERLENSSDVNVTAPFSRKLTRTEEEVAYHLLSVLHDTLTDARITYWMYAGTLLGSYRHHDYIPWDDDFDVISDIATRTVLVERLGSLGPKYKVHEAGSRVKFCLSAGGGRMPETPYPWTFPYVDVSFYRHNGSVLYDASDSHDQGDVAFVFGREHVFPLRRRPLGPLWLTAPYDTWAVLNATYPRTLHSCQSSHYRHRTETLDDQHVQIVPCRRLSLGVPFVHRRLVRGAQPSQHEELQLAGHLLHTLAVDEPELPGDKARGPYTLLPGGD